MCLATLAAQKAPRSEDYAGKGDESGLPWGGPKWAPQSKALKLKGLFPIHLPMSHWSPPVQWLVDWQAAWFRHPNLGEAQLMVGGVDPSLPQAPL